jgi:hypothetical protein
MAEIRLLGGLAVHGNAGPRLRPGTGGVQQEPHDE